jgi:hypothetical protein
MITYCGPFVLGRPNAYQKFNCFSYKKIPENIRWSLPDECQAVCKILTDCRARIGPSLNLLPNLVVSEIISEIE